MLTGKTNYFNRFSSRSIYIPLSHLTRNTNIPIDTTKICNKISDSNCNTISHNHGLGFQKNTEQQKGSLGIKSSDSREIIGAFMNFATRRYPLILILLIMTVITLCGCGVSGDVKEDLLSTDTLPPTISSTYPADGATGFAANSAITATFSETMDASTITTATFTVAGVTGTVTYSATTATFKPSANLAYSTTYTATISTDVKDAAGNAMADNYTWTFTTGVEPDTTPPTVSSTTPENSVTGVAVNTAITATFSETMDASTITTATFTLLNGATPVLGDVTYSGTTATFTPSPSLNYNTDYTATITTGVKDLAGNAMASNYPWTFTTAPAGTTTLTWDAPTANADGTPLTDLAGYKIYYGTSTGNYSIPIEKPLGSAGLNCLAIQSKTECSFGVALVSGIYYFSVTAYDTLGNESVYSNEISKTIP